MSGIQKRHNEITPSVEGILRPADEPMTPYEKQRHAAAMLVHQVCVSGVEALEAMPIILALENLHSMHDGFIRLGRFIVRLQQIEFEKNELYRSHQ